MRDAPAPPLDQNRKQQALHFLRAGWSAQKEQSELQLFRVRDLIHIQEGAWKIVKGHSQPRGTALHTLRPAV